MEHMVGNERIQESRAAHHIDAAEDVDITIHSIYPAYVKTPLVEKQIAAQAKTHGISEDQVVNEIMLKPMPKRAFGIDEIAGIIAFLISPPARNITGQTIVVDGGWTAH